MSTSLPHVFVSTTSQDLQSFRQTVSQALLTRKAHPVQQDTFPPNYRSVIEILRQEIQKCDAVVCLIGFVYGQEPRRRPKKEARQSYTQLERAIAIELGKPVFLFLATENCPFDQSLEEIAEPDELRALQMAYRDEICQGDQAYHEFSSKEELKSQIAFIDFSSLPLKMSTEPEEEEESGSGHQDQVLDRVRGLLSQMQEKTFEAVKQAVLSIVKQNERAAAQRFADDTGYQAIARMARKQGQMEAMQLTDCLIRYCPIDLVMQKLVQLLKDRDLESLLIADVVDEVLPLNYDRQLVKSLSEQIRSGMGFVEKITATPTLVEVLLAGYDQQPAQYATWDRGEAALPFRKGPPVGVGGPGSKDVGLLLAVRDLLFYLQALVDEVFLGEGQAEGELDAVLDPDALTEEIDSIAGNLQGSLEAHSDDLDGRTIYCALRLPLEDIQRRFQVKVFQEAHQLIGGKLLFVELIDFASKDSKVRAGKLEQQIKMRLVRSRQAT